MCYASVHGVVERHGPGVRIDGEPPGHPLARGHPLRGGRRRHPAAPSAIAGPASRRRILGAIAREESLFAEARVRRPGILQTLECARVQCRALGLAVGLMRATDLRTLVPVEPQPRQILEDGRLEAALAPVGVRVLDAHDEGPAGTSRDQPVKQRRARTAEMQEP